MKVHFIGAGPGAADLITVRGLRLIESCPVCLYAGSLVPEAIVAAAPKDARVVDTAPLNLDEIMAEIADAQSKNLNVARVHSGDPSIYGAIAEQMRRLDAMGIEYDVTPGVPAFAAAAAQLKLELTVPEVCQTIIVTRTAMKSSEMPKGEELSTLAKSNATLAIHLSIRNLAISSAKSGRSMATIALRLSPTASAGRTRHLSTARSERLPRRSGKPSLRAPR